MKRRLPRGRRAENIRHIMKSFVVMLSEVEASHMTFPWHSKRFFDCVLLLQNSAQNDRRDVATRGMASKSPSIGNW
jgi:hypothetical protein